MALPRREGDIYTNLRRVFQNIEEQNAELKTKIAAKHCIDLLEANKESIIHRERAAPMIDFIDSVPQSNDILRNIIIIDGTAKNKSTLPKGAKGLGKKYTVPEELRVPISSGGETAEDMDNTIKTGKRLLKGLSATAPRRTKQKKFVTSKKSTKARKPIGKGAAATGKGPGRPRKQKKTTSTEQEEIPIESEQEELPYEAPISSEQEGTLPISPRRKKAPPISPRGEATPSGSPISTRRKQVKTPQGAYLSEGERTPPISPKGGEGTPSVSLIHTRKQVKTPEGPYLSVGEGTPKGGATPPLSPIHIRKQVKTPEGQYLSEEEILNRETDEWVNIWNHMASSLVKEIRSAERTAELNKLSPVVLEIYKKNFSDKELQNEILNKMMANAIIIRGAYNTNKITEFVQLFTSLWIVGGGRFAEILKAMERNFLKEYFRQKGNSNKNVIEAHMKKFNEYVFDALSTFMHSLQVTPLNAMKEINIKDIPENLNFKFFEPNYVNKTTYQKKLNEKLSEIITSQ